MAMIWKDKLQNTVLEQYGIEHGTVIGKKYRRGFSASYIDDTPVPDAIKDIEYLERLSEKNPLLINLHVPASQSERVLHLRLYQWQKLVPLSDILPILENFNLRTESGRPYKVQVSKQQVMWISDFTLMYPDEPKTEKSVNGLFHEALTRVYFGESENDGFNKLVLGASLSWRDIIILRAYVKYLLQIGFRFSQSYIEKTLADNPAAVRALIALFKYRHDPAMMPKDEKENDRLEQCVIQELESVVSLDEDRIIRRLLDLIKATLRTNYFQQTTEGETRPYLSIKFNSAAIPELPLPVPLYEIFVYSTAFEGIHLRKDNIARGGIRWSDRREDFRTEVLGLMKAQVVKNTVIVPSGAKGGFVLKTLPAAASRDLVQKNVVACYQSFIRSLLDLTDNVDGEHFKRPPQVVCYDGIDPYMVVAADKGTATFSDIANGIANEYGFWLGDAFASGGSVGYDHKKMGITARGAWESIKRHFRELDYDISKKDITVAGIGDMSGDVFGNGMLYSRHIKLVAAFDHRHIFIDPDPDPERSYQERERLFNLPASSWEDYNPDVMSAGGGVFKRSVKFITLTAPMQKALGVDDHTLTPNDLICAILKAPVDLLYNGGVGTYVKSSQENAMDAGDRTNDFCRVNGKELRCKVVGEGGNLGFTQLGRVEYALTGGLMYTDFIDNSAGVDCSDHEVNLKILLDKAVHLGYLQPDQRNNFLYSLTDEVARSVLKDNKNQALVMSFSAYSAKKNIGLHIEYINELEAQGLLNRRVEFLPTDKELLDRKAAGLGLTRPELAVLLAYTKIYIKKEIIKSKVSEEPCLSQTVSTAFPPSIQKAYYGVMQEHRLKSNIVATQLSNDIVNNMGMTYVYRMQLETGASVEDIVRAYTLVSKSFETNTLQDVINSLDFKISMSEQFDMLRNIRKLINLATRWFLKGNRHQGDLSRLIDYYSAGIKAVETLIPDLMSGDTKHYLDLLVEKFIKAEIPHETAQRIATFRAIYTALNIIEVAGTHNFDLEKTARVYFAGGERMNLVWFRDQLASDQREDYWHALTRLTLRDELDVLQRALTVAIIHEDKDEENAQRLIDKWVTHHGNTVARWDKFLALLHRNPNVEYSMFFIAIRELTDLIR